MTDTQQELEQLRPAAAARRVQLRAALAGADDLATADLLALLAGSRGSVADGDLASLAHSTSDELRRRQGWTAAGAARVHAAFALARRLGRVRAGERPIVRAAADVATLLAAEFAGLERETFHVLALDGKHRLKARELVSVGSLTASLVHPREVFRPAVRCAAAAIVCAHNHPSGDPEPSAEDLEVTRRLQSAGRVLGIPLLDHVVIGDGRFVSLRERLGF